MPDPRDSFSALLRQNPVDSTATFPYAKLVPRIEWVGTRNEWGQPDVGDWDRSKNMAFREWINERGATDDLDRKLILQVCARDPLFFINAFLWIKQESPVPADLPFITWERQEQYLELSVRKRREVESDVTGKVRFDLLSDKCREVGWTWLNLAEGLHIIRFIPGSTALIGSRVDYDVDKRGASKTLYWKLDYFIEKLPPWMMPAEYWNAKKGHPIPSIKHRGDKRLTIPGFGTMLGSPTHENFGRSGRYQWMLPDEFAHVDRGQVGMGDKIWSATTATCRSRRPVSTPNGRNNKFCQLRHSLPSEVFDIFTVHWYDDPAKMVGGYRLKDSMEIGPVTLHEGDWWSPWAESTRKAYDNDALFAQEILLSYEGVGGCFYEGQLPRIKHEQVKEPVLTGNVKLKDDGKGPRIGEIKSDPISYFRAWERFEDGVQWKTGRYVLGIDVASGSRNQEGRGASNSVVCIGRIEGKRLVKVAQYMTHGLAPHLFARVVCAIGWSFRGSLGQPAYAIWERNGPGEIMGNSLLYELNYPGSCVFWETSANAGVSVPGFQMNTHRKGDGTLVGSKVNVFNEHLAWLETGDYTEPSYDTYREMEQYTYTEDAGAEFAKRRRSMDPSEGRDNHGDSVIGTVLMIWAAREIRKQSENLTSEFEAPRLSVGWAQARVKREASKAWR